MTYYIESLGCAKNLVDSERFSAIMESYGMQAAWDPTETDLILVNSCAFLRRSLAELDLVLELIIDVAKAKLIVTGCVTTRALEEYQELYPEVDAWIMLKDFDGFEKYLKTRVLPKNAKSAKLPEAGRVKSNDGQYVYLRISDGCENYCSYCMIPTIRCKLVSEPIEKLGGRSQSYAKRGREAGHNRSGYLHECTDIYGYKALPQTTRSLV
jgi:ribosomal protein S12 methylthiotransferase